MREKVIKEIKSFLEDIGFGLILFLFGLAFYLLAQEKIEKTISGMVLLFTIGVLTYFIYKKVKKDFCQIKEN